MDFQRWRSEWGGLLIAAILSFVLYQVNMLVFFCIPLQVLFIRKGDRNLLYACASVFATIVVVTLIRTAQMEDAVFKRGILLTQISLPAFVMAGVIAMDLPWKIRLRTVYKVLAVTFAAGVVSIPFIYLLSRNNGISQFIKAQAESVARIFQTGVEESQGATFAIDVDTLTSYIINILLKSYLFVYFLTVAGSLWIGRSIAARMSGSWARGLRGLRLPDRLIWLLLVSWAVVLVDFLAGIGAFGYAAWNIGAIMLFIYGMQGIGIIQSLLDRRNVSRYLRIILGAGLLALTMWPGVNLVVLIGLPVLGVSELWIHYRKEQEE